MQRAWWPAKFVIMKTRFLQLKTLGRVQRMDLGLARHATVAILAIFLPTRRLDNAHRAVADKSSFLQSLAVLELIQT